jgi:hypothetical protein
MYFAEDHVCNCWVVLSKQCGAWVAYACSSSNSSSTSTELVKHNLVRDIVRSRSSISIGATYLKPCRPRSKLALKEEAGLPSSVTSVRGWLCVPRHQRLSCLVTVLRGAQFIYRHTRDMRAQEGVTEHSHSPASDCVQATFLADRCSHDIQYLS